MADGISKLTSLSQIKKRTNENFSFTVSSKTEMHCCHANVRGLVNLRWLRSNKSNKRIVQYKYKKIEQLRIKLTKIILIKTKASSVKKNQVAVVVWFLTKSG